jgi:hypothetical protein
MRLPRQMGSLPPPPFGANERFELPIAPTFLDEATETAEQHQKRIKALRRTARRFFRALSNRLGDEETRKLFESFFRKRRKGRRPGTSNAERDSALLEEYYDRKRTISSEDELGALPRAIAREAHRRFPGRLGSSADAIEKQLRRLLTKQEQGLRGTKIPPN